MPAPDNDKALNGLLQRSLRRSVPAADCPPPDILAAYQEGSLAADELARHELHFSTCARCREQLAAISRAASGAEVEVPVLAAKAAASEAPPAAAVAAPREDRAHPRRRIWFLDWRVLAPVAAALAFTAILYTRLINRPAAPSGPQTEVAMSKPEAPSSSVAERVAPPSQPAETPAPAAPAPAPPAAQKNAPVVRDRALFSKKAESQAADAARKDRERAEAMARELERRRLSNSLEANRDETAARPATGAAAGAPAASAPNAPGAVAGAAGAGVVGGRSTSKSLFAAKMKAGSAVSGAPANAPPAAPPAAPAGEANPSKKIPAATQSVEVTGQAVAVGTPQPSKDALAPAQMPANLQSNARNVVNAMSVSVEKEPIKSPDPAVMYRIADGGFIERTQDGGATWQGQQVDPSAQFVAGAAPAAKICWLVGNGGAVFLSKDGINWAKIPPPTKADLVAVTATSASSATVTTGDGRKFSTRDGGKTWTLLQ